MTQLEQIAQLLGHVNAEIRKAGDKRALEAMQNELFKLAIMANLFQRMPPIIISKESWEQLNAKRKNDE